MFEIFGLAVKIIFFVSLGAMALMMLWKLPLVRTLSEGESVPIGEILSRDWKKIRDFGLATPKKAKELIVKNKGIISTQLEAVKHFSEQRLVYHFKKVKKSLPKPSSNTNKNNKATEGKNFEGDYWDKIQRQ